MSNATINFMDCVLSHVEAIVYVSPCESTQPQQNTYISIISTLGSNLPHNYLLNASTPDHCFAQSCPP